MKENLTPAFVKDVKPPVTGRDEYWDTKQAGLCLRVTATGHKSYLVQYRAGGRGSPLRKQTLDFAIGLDGARRKAKQIMGAVSGGADPVQEKQDQEAAERQAKQAEKEAEHTTVKAILESYLNLVCGVTRDEEGSAVYDKSDRTTGEKISAYERFVYPKLGTYQIETLSRKRITAMLDAIARDNGEVMADRTLSYLSVALNWHAARTDEWVSPVVRGMARTKPRERAGKRCLNDEEIRDLWQALDTVRKVPACYPAYVRALLLTALRLRECSKGSRAEITMINRHNLDGFVGETWIIPAARMKPGVDHAVPLTAAVKALIGDATGERGGYLFSTTRGKRPFSGFSKAKAALNARIAEIRKADGRDPMPNWTHHDLRRTAKTLMLRAGVRPDITERVISHVIPGVEGVYDCHEYLAEKYDALEKLAVLVDRIVHPADNVTELRPSAAAAVS